MALKLLQEAVISASITEYQMSFVFVISHIASVYNREGGSHHMSWLDGFHLYSYTIRIYTQPNQFVTDYKSVTYKKSFQDINHLFFLKLFI